MVDQKPIEEPKVQISEGFFERLLGRTIGKSADEEEAPVSEPQKEEEDAVSKLEARIEKLEAEVAALKKDEPKEPVKDAVVKSEGESEGESAESEEAETETAEDDETLDESQVVAKSKSLDPDTIEVSTSEKSLVERSGRNANGMTW